MHVHMHVCAAMDCHATTMKPGWHPWDAGAQRQRGRQAPRAGRGACCARVGIDCVLRRAPCPPHRLHRCSPLPRRRRSRRGLRRGPSVGAAGRQAGTRSSTTIQSAARRFCVRCSTCSPTTPRAVHKARRRAWHDHCHSCQASCCISRFTACRPAVVGQPALLAWCAGRPALQHCLPRAPCLLQPA